MKLQFDPWEKFSGVVLVGKFTCLRNKLSILTARAKICTSLEGESEERNTFPYANSRVNEPTTTFNTNCASGEYKRERDRD